MNKVVLLVLGALMLAVSPALAANPTAPRIALVIGNGDYETVGDLPNVHNDASLMQQTLDRIGFQVTLIENASRSEFLSGLEEFRGSLHEGAIVVVYYAGHGVQVEGENYLIPVDAAPRRLDDLKGMSVAASQILREIAGSNPEASILILDACRDNPFTEGTVSGLPSGMASIDVSLSNNLVAFSTSPGKVAFDGPINAEGNSNSPYTKALAESLVQPGLSIESVFKRARSQVIGDTSYDQVPWENSSLTLDLFLIPGGTNGLPQLDDCDLLAGHPTDPLRVHAGVAYQLLRPAPAVAACRAAVAREPANPRYISQLARALEKAGEVDEAARLNEKAVSMGYLGGYHNLGNLYRKGAGVPRDPDKALALFKYAAERGHPEDAYNVGVLYLSGTDLMPADNEQARLWFERAILQDYPSAFDRLGIIYRDGLSVETDHDKANEYFARGAELGDAAAIVNLATSYRKGTGVEVDYARALELYLRAAQLRRTSAYVNLGDMYANGQGSGVDLQEAAFWFGLAMRDGNERAIAKYKEVTTGMTESEIEQVQQRIEDWLASNFG